MESFKKYRDDLAKKIKDTRSFGDHGKEAAKVLLQDEQGTKIYRQAQQLHKNLRDDALEIKKIEQEIQKKQQRIDNLQTNLKDVKKIFEKENSSVETIKFPIWKTIELSTKTPEQYTKELIAQGNQIDPWTKSILEKIEPLKSPEQINLVSLSVEQLGFPNGATLFEIYERAHFMGLEVCPPQVGPELRLSYTDQPNDQYLRIVMLPIIAADGVPSEFYVGRTDSVLWLDYYYAYSHAKLDSNDRFVFRSSK